MKSAGPTSPPASRRARVLATGSGLALAAALALNLVHSVLEALHGGGEDFLSFASAGRIVSSGSHCLYCHDTLAQQQANLLGYWPVHPLNFPNDYVNPPLFAFFMQPIAALPLGTGLALWVALLVVAMAVAVVLVTRLVPSLPPGDSRTLFALVVVASAPAASGVLLGQVDPLLLLPALAALVLLRGGRPFAAGLVLAAVLVKPQLGWLIVPALAAAGMWRMLGGYLAGAAVWIVTAPLILGFDHLGDVFSVLTSSDQQRQLGEARSLPGVFGLVHVAGAPVVAFSVLAGLAVSAALWRSRSAWRAHPELALGIGVLASLDLAPHLFSHDYILLAIPLVVWAARRPWPALLAAATMNGAYLVDVSVPIRFAHLQALVVTVIGIAIWADVTGRPAPIAISVRRRAAGATAPGSRQVGGSAAAAG